MTNVGKKTVAESIVIMRTFNLHVSYYNCSLRFDRMSLADELSD
jgi:hypothetical protein